MTRVAGEVREPRAGSSSPLAPPRDADYGVVPWDAPSPAVPPPTRGAERAKNEPLATAATTVFGVRLRGRSAGFADAGMNVIELARRHPVATLAVGCVAGAIAVRAPAVMLVATGVFAAYEASRVAQLEAQALTTADSAQQERLRFESGQHIFGLATSLPLRLPIRAAVR